MNTIRIENLPISGVVKVFDICTEQVVFSGTEDIIPDNIGRQIPVRMYCVDDVIYIDIRYNHD